MRVILLTHGGAELVIKEICGKPDLELVGVFIETKQTPERSFKEKLKRSVKYDGYFETIKKFGGKLVGKNATVEEAATSGNPTVEAAQSFGVPVHFLDDYHSAGSLEQIRNANADLGIVFGTNIIKESVFGIPRLGSINLHQGLAPYYRGGPPVFWELFNDEKEVGLTVHFVASKVDTGDIVLQKTVELAYDFGYGDDFQGFIDDYRRTLRKDCAEMVASAAELIASGDFPRTTQDTTLGKRYRLPVKSEKDEMRRRLLGRKP
ncbi:MAG: formyltransferase family protein [Pyrinomonadaceae bacterium]